MASFWEDEDKMAQLGALGFGLLQGSGWSTDPSNRSFGAALGKGGMAMLQQAQQQKADKRANRALALQEEELLGKQHELLRKQGMLAQAGGWWKDAAPKGGSPSEMSAAYRMLGDKLASAGNMEFAKQAYDQAKAYQEKFSAPITAMVDGKPVLAQPSDLSASPRILSGMAPKPEFKEAPLGDKMRVYNALDPSNASQWNDWLMGVSPSTKYMADNQPNAIIQVAGGGFAAVPTRGANPTATPVMPRQGIGSSPQDVQVPKGSLPVTASGALAAPESVPAAVTEKLATSEVFVKNIDKTLKELQKAPGAVGLQNVLPNLLMDKFDPKGVPTRAGIADVGSLKILERSGAAVTVGESERTKPFIPKPTDGPETVKYKLERLREIALEEAEAFRKQYRTIPETTQPVAPSGVQYRREY
jgi:hypothetical protein